MIAKSQLQPIIIVVGDHRMPEQIFLCSEKKLLEEVNVNNAAVVILSTYYSYNLCYPKGTTNIYSFLEAALTKIAYISPTVNGLLILLDRIMYNLY